MIGRRFRGGSALLVVLGLLVFISTSAIAFSVYMRQQRLPSSLARRTATTRQLVKAALARAIEAVDRDAGNAPMANIVSSAGGSQPSKWQHRVYTPTGGFAQNELGLFPVLTLEALAYLPPNLVNDVRYYSRLTESAGWHILPFDLGRYAFVAVDVSDYLDVNKLVANEPRSSASNRRVGIAHIFENDDHSDPGDPGKWDDFMKKFRTIDEDNGTFTFEDGQLPLVSLADFNLALYAKGGKTGVAGLKSPFGIYVSGSGSQSDAFYDETGDGGLERYLRMTFVTDSYFPKELSKRRWEPNPRSLRDDLQGEDRYFYDLTDAKYQPFRGSDLDSGSIPRVDKLVNDKTNAKAMERLQKSMPLLSKVALWDYLDADSTPTSLAVPTVERNAMVCGFQLVPSAGTTFSVVSSRKEESETVTTDQGEAKKVTRTVVIGPDADALGQAIAGTQVKVLYTYPFAHEDGVAAKFKIDARVAYYFAKNESGYIPIRRDFDASSSGVLDYARKPDLNPDKSKLADFESGFDKVAFVVQFEPQEVSFPATGNDAEEKAVDFLRFLPGGTTLKADVVALGAEEIEEKGATRKVLPVVKAVWTWTQDKNGNPKDPPADVEPEVTSAVGLVNKDGSAFTPDDIVTDFKAGNFNSSFRFEAAVWAKVTMDDEVVGGEQVVDLAPACMLDDGKVRQGVDNRGMAQQIDKIGEGGSPLIKFVLDHEFSLKMPGQNGATPDSQDFVFARPTAFVADPRYNHAPENWFTSDFDQDDDAALRTRWLQDNKARDIEGDIFMEVSDQGYLQSIYELAFIPCLTDGISGFRRNDNDDGMMAIFGDLSVHSGYAVRDTLPKSFEETKDQSLAWNTYCPYGGADDFNEFGFCSDGRGFKVNPYSDATNVLFSVFANTPISWRLASTNVSEDAAVNPLKMTAVDFNKKYAYCDYNAKCRLSWYDLDRLVSVAGGSVRGNYNGNLHDWEDAWRNLNWDFDPTNPNYLFGVEMNPDNYTFTSADRKFLYGYWHDCFGVGQQLFLVFVRCEPLMLGSNSTELIPPQLSTRAVALVWRDANQPYDEELGQVVNGAPHRTRILFYRQFE